MDSRDLRNLSESYSLIEEQNRIDDFCIAWVQERIDENVDFSQYTQEEIIESIEKHIQEAGNMGYTPLPNIGQGISNWFSRNLQAWKNRGVSPRIGLNQKQQPAAQPASSQNLRGLTIGPGGFNINNKPVQTAPVPVRSTVRPTVRPTTTAAPAPTPTATAAPAPRPTATAATADTAPAKPAGGAVADKVTPAAPARRSLAQDLADLRAMRTASQMRQKGQKINGKIPTGADVQAASRSVSDFNKAARQYQTNSADLFDIVKGYLLDEGATEEEALKRMAVMTEEERNEIIESSCGGGHSKKKKKKSGY